MTTSKKDGISNVLMISLMSIVNQHVDNKNEVKRLSKMKYFRITRDFKMPSKIKMCCHLCCHFRGHQGYED